jgi:hypothetical protein
MMMSKKLQGCRQNQSRQPVLDIYSDLLCEWRRTRKNRMFCRLLTDCTYVGYKSDKKS